MATITELKPANSQKSFYGKAMVATDGNGTQTLLSYGTPVAKWKDGKITRLWAGKSATTTKHIAAFLAHLGVSMTTKEFNSMAAA